MERSYTINITNIVPISDVPQGPYSPRIISVTPIDEAEKLNLLASGTTVPFSVGASQNVYKFAKFSQINDPNFAVKTFGGDTYIQYIGNVFTYCTLMLTPINWNTDARYQIWLNATNIFPEGLTDPNILIKFSLDYKWQELLAIRIRSPIGITGTITLQLVNA